MACVTPPLLPAKATPRNTGLRSSGALLSLNIGFDESAGTNSTQPFKVAAAAPVAFPPKQTASDCFDAVGIVKAAAALPPQLEHTPISVIGTTTNPTATAESWKKKVFLEQQSVLRLNEEEQRLAAEEAVLRSQLAEVTQRHRAIDAQQAAIHDGWSSLYNQQQQFLSEPTQDLTPEIAAMEERVALAKSALDQEASKLAVVECQLSSFKHLEARQAECATTIEKIIAGFETLETRRRAAVATAERYFDCEGLREREAATVCTRLKAEMVEEELKLEALRAEEQETIGGGKSVILDLGGPSCVGGMSETFISSFVAGADTLALGGEPSVVFSLTGAKRARHEAQRELPPTTAA